MLGAHAESMIASCVRTEYPEAGEGKIKEKAKHPTARIRNHFFDKLSILCTLTRVTNPFFPEKWEFGGPRRTPLLYRLIDGEELARLALCAARFGCFGHAIVGIVPGFGEFLRLGLRSLPGDAVTFLNFPGKLIAFSANRLQIVVG